MSSGNSQKTTTSNTQQTGPWGPQQGYLENAFNSAQNVYNGQANNNFSGNMVAQPTDLQNNTMANMLNWANQGKSMADTVANQGTNMTDQGASNMQGAATGLYNMAGEDATGMNIANAGRYANNPYMDGMINSATQDARRTFSDSTIPGINQVAAGSGNNDSTRAGVASGIAQRGLDDFVGNTSASMRGNAYQAGIGQSQADRAMKIQELQGEGALGSSQASNGLSASGLYGALMNDSTNTANSANSAITAQNQAPLDNALQKYQFGNQDAWSKLQNYMGIVGGQNWGSQGSSTGVSNVQQQPSTLNTIGSIGGILGSLFKSDIRTKENIRQIGHTPDGLFPLYRFNYIGDESRAEHVAPMAQDVEAIYPDAILELGGVKHIMTHTYDWRN